MVTDLKIPLSSSMNFCIYTNLFLIYYFIKHRHTHTHPNTNANSTPHTFQYISKQYSVSLIIRLLCVSESLKNFDKMRLLVSRPKHLTQQGWSETHILKTLTISHLLLSCWSKDNVFISPEIDAIESEQEEIK